MAKDGTSVRILDQNENISSAIHSIIEGGQTDPFYVCDVSDVIWKYKNWMEVFPRIHPFYAVKCNQTKLVLETLAKMGANFDCASPNEISTIISLGVSPDRIIFAHPAKKETHIEYAADVGVNVMTFDCLNELHKVKKFHPKARLVLRIRHDDKCAKYQLGEKFGVRSDAEAEQLLSVASTLKLDVIGVCFHVGTYIRDIYTYENAIESARRVFDIGPKYGYNFKLLDIGGGFLGHKGSSIEKVGMVVNRALEKFFPDKSVKITSQPGRYFVSSAFSLLTQINTVKRVQVSNPDSNYSEMIMYYLDVGIFNSLILTLVGERYKIKPLRDNAVNRNDLPSIAWGPTCNCLDMITDGVEYLPEMKVGEWLTLENTGSYTMSIASNFNGFSIPAVYGVIKEEDSCLLKALHDAEMEK